MSAGRSSTEPQRGFRSRQPATTGSQPRLTPSAPLCQSALCLQPDPRGPDWRASGLFPGRPVYTAPTSHVPAAAQHLAARGLRRMTWVPKPWPLPSSSSRCCGKGSSSFGRGGDYPNVAPCYALSSPSFLAAASKAPPKPFTWEPSLGPQTPAAGTGLLCGGARVSERLALPGSGAEMG